MKLTFEFHSRWVHLAASQTIATLAQTHPRSNCHNGSHCDALRTNFDNDPENQGIDQGIERDKVDENGRQFKEQIG